MQRVERPRDGRELAALATFVALRAIVSKLIGRAISTDVILLPGMIEMPREAAISRLLSEEPDRRLQFVGTEAGGALAVARWPWKEPRKSTYMGETTSTDDGARDVSGDRVDFAASWSATRARGSVLLLGIDEELEISPDEFVNWESHHKILFATRIIDELDQRAIAAGCWAIATVSPMSDWRESAGST